MKIKPTTHGPAIVGATSDVAAAQAAPGAEAEASVIADVPSPKAERSALLAAPATSKPAATGRARAPWTDRAEAIAAAALGSAKGLTGDAAVRTVLDAVLAMPEVARGTVSAAVARSGTVIVTRGTMAAVNPCSNTKLVTAAYALSVLGAGHRFETALLRSPDGTLAFVGGFDPTPTMDSLVAMAHALKDAGVTSVPRVVLDNGALEGTNVPAAFERYGDEDWEYVARPEPLSVHKNALHILITPGARLGFPAQIEADQTAFTIRNRVETVNAGTPFKIGCDELDTAGVLQRGADGKAIIDVWGTIAADYTKGKPLVMKSPSPTESFADRVAAALDLAGIVHGPVEVGAAPPGSVAVHTHRSAPLGEILRESLSTSNAFDHEMFALAAATKETGAPITLATAAKHLHAFLVAQGGEGVLVNASGIGNENRLRAADIVRLLERARVDAALHPLLDALARPGARGTLKTRMLDTPAENLFAGKTGTGEGAAALSGVVGDLSFSVLVAENPGRESTRAALDGLAIALATLARA